MTRAKPATNKRSPPGFKDKDDSNPNQYGDLVIWKEILNLGAEKKQPVIFVTDDAKEDWWWKHGGETQGPRVELVNEYWAKAERRIHFYEPLRFLQYAKKQTNTNISRESLEEVEEVSSANSRAHRVLRERKQQLEGQQASYARQIETHLGRNSPSQLAELHSELETLVAQEQGLKAHIKMMRAQTAEAADGYRRDSSESPSDFFKRIDGQREEIENLERHVSTMTVRRDSLEKRLRRGDSGEDRLERAWRERLLSNQAELNEVNLALEELTE